MTTPIPAAASQWDLPAPKVVTIGSFASEVRLIRTRAAQGNVKHNVLSVSPRSTMTGAMTPVLKAVQRRVEVFGSSSDLLLDRTGPARRSTSGGPDVFGSVAMTIGSTPYDSMWRHASAVNSRALVNWTGPFAGLHDSDPARLLREVNAWVNHRLDFVEDNVDGVPAEIWQSASQSLRSGSGDCEDYALAKHGMPTVLGFDRNDLYLVIVRDLIARSHHAVLAVRTGGRFVILDSAIDELVEGDRANDYRPLFSYSTAGRWIHGYPGSPSQPPVRIAAATTAFRTP